MHHLTLLRRPALCALCAASLLLLAACDSDSGSDDENDLADGTFTASITGDFEASFSGEALYGVITEEADSLFEGEEAFVIGMLAAAGQDSTIILLTRAGAQRPGVGTYDIVNILDTEGELPTDAFWGLFVRDEGEVFLISEAGELEITASGTTLEGTFSFSGDEFFGTRDADIEGRFAALEDNAFGLTGAAVRTALHQTQH